MRQLTFAHERGARRAPIPAGPYARLGAQTTALRAAKRAADVSDAGKRAALRALRKDLAHYICALGVDAEFQASDFWSWLNEVGRAPSVPASRGGLDPRACGALFVALVRDGVLVRVGVRANAGCRATGYHSTPRAVYRVALLDFSGFLRGGEQEEAA